MEGQEGSETPTAPEQPLHPLQGELLRRYGTTKDPFEAAFILSNGTLIKETGKEHHRSMVGAIREENPELFETMGDFLKCGVVRFGRSTFFKDDIVAAEFNVIPNDRQVATLVSASRGTNSVVLTYTDPEDEWEPLLTYDEHNPNGATIRRFVNSAAELEEKRRKEAETPS